MPLEATMLIIDNSEYMRNGDYQPTRFDAQADAVNVIFQTKIDSNPENTVGIMTMAGKAPEVLVTHTKDLGQVLGGVHAASNKIGGEIDIPTALAVAQLALKHRENKNLRQRVIVFVGSPLGDGPAADEQAMIKLAKKLKKNNVAVDIVAFGDGIEEGDGPKVLKSFVDNINSSDNSHLLTVQPGTHLLSDALISSPILSADRSASIPEEFGGTGAGAPAAGSSSANDFEFGVDPSIDPELAMALRMSMQEAQAREAAQAAASSAAAPPAAPSTSTPAAPATTSTTTTVPADPTDDEEERMLQEALALSKQENTEGGDDDEDDEDDDEEDGDVEMAEGDDGDDDDDDEEEEDEDEDAAIAKAIEMSMQTHQDEQNKPKKK
ncbi:hypothetical protein D9613_011411 [Agrocybe pediades]|uniref:VWFA domain-containing protein n=1 Tax=Agrocybe pediades TaxID=84607 RepID=A0A8H4QSG5_9AGAR|nr:hypothetical protein D9613_011411 [Agrocybe pediades]KAF9563356.1 hypothetical protein CPC08DRAFT_749007 [Agrocybe pediades]